MALRFGNGSSHAWGNPGLNQDIHNADLEYPDRNASLDGDEMQNSKVYYFDVMRPPSLSKLNKSADQIAKTDTIHVTESQKMRPANGDTRRFASAEQEIQYQRIQISELHEKLEIYELRLIDTVKQMEKSLANNKRLVVKTMDLEDSLNETQQKWITMRRDYNNLEQWTSNSRSMADDYEGALRELDLRESLSDNQRPDLLTRQVKVLVKEKREAEDRARNYNRELTQMKLEQDSILQHSKLESERLKAGDKSHQDQMDRIESQVSIKLN